MILESYNKYVDSPEDIFDITDQKVHFELKGYILGYPNGHFGQQRLLKQEEQTV